MATEAVSVMREGARLMRGATYAAVAVAASLVAVKLGAWLVTGSVAMLSTLVDSMLDVAASVVNLLAVRHALTPADRQHRFGHGKAEALAGLGQAAFIAGSAVFIWVEAGHRLFSPRPVESASLGIAIMIVSIVATLGLVLFQRQVIRRTKSVAISADSLHYKGDVLVNLSVIAALVLAGRPGWGWIDPGMGAAIALYVQWSAWMILRQSLDQLMDRELPDAERRRIREIVLAHPAVRAMHDLRTRASGRNSFIQLHVELDPGLTLLSAHEIADEVEARVLEAYPGAEVLIHQDPLGVEERRATFAR